MKEETVRCDNPTCGESYPRFHSENGPGFKDGKWLGWNYLDLNRPDLSSRPLRFCSIRCLVWWLATTKTAFKGMAAAELQNGLLMEWSASGAY